MKEKLAYMLMAVLETVLVICAATCTAPWWTGHDNGEAYEAYTEAIEKYEIPPDGYW